MRGAQYEQLPIARRDRASQQHSAERQPPAEEARVPDERREYVQRRPARSRHLGEQLACLLVSLGFGQRRDARRSRHRRSVLRLSCAKR